MKVEVHVAEAVVPLSEHVVNEPVTPVCERPTVPVGVTKVPVAVSVTVTVQADPWFTTTGVVQLTVVEVDLRGADVMESRELALLEVCEVSPGYDAVI